MTLATFVSNIGGQVGLWLGISFISLVQLFVLIWAWIYNSLRPVEVIECE